MPRHVGQDLGDLGLADAGLAFEEQRAPELEREEHGGRERALRDVALLAERRGDALDGAGRLGARRRRRSGGGRRCRLIGSHGPRSYTAWAGRRVVVACPSPRAAVRAWRAAGRRVRRRVAGRWLARRCLLAAGQLAAGPDDRDPAAGDLVAVPPEGDDHDPDLDDRVQDPEPDPALRRLREGPEDARARVLGIRRGPDPRAGDDQQVARRAARRRPAHQDPVPGRVRVGPQPGPLRELHGRDRRRRRGLGGGRRRRRRGRRRRRRGWRRGRLRRPIGRGRRPRCRLGRPLRGGLRCPVGRLRRLGRRTGRRPRRGRRGRRRHAVRPVVLDLDAALARSSPRRRGAARSRRSTRTRHRPR